MSIVNRPSLLDLFHPPKGMVGDFGWICGFSAESSFMEEAAQRFSLGGKRSRMSDGHVVLALLLDPTCPMLTSVPGVVHIPALGNLNSAQSCRLVHAKVAILNFRSDNISSKDVIRLIVSTGNWTRQTVNSSIDLFWSIDINFNRKQISPQDGADFHAAWNMMSWLMEKHDLSLLHRQTIDPKLYEDRRLKNLVDQIPKSKERPRFIDNRNKSLLQCIAAEVTKNTSSKRNRIVMGSGFFEGGEGEGLPYVPQAILKELSETLTESCLVALVVNPESCQAIASSRAAIIEQNWKLLEARLPSVFGKARRGLHAKFIFSAGYRSNSSSCLNNWIYLGSGNLTRPGFTEKAGARGNLEAGVILFDEDLHWSSADVVNHLSSYLPFCWDDPDTMIEELAHGADEPDFEPKYIASPIPYLIWQPSIDGLGGTLAPPSGTPIIDIAMLDISNGNLPFNKGVWIWEGNQPALVSCKYEGHTHQLLVVDEVGRIGSGKLPPISLDEALARLLSFPSSAPEDTDVEDEDDIPEIILANFDQPQINPTVNLRAKAEALRPTLGAIEAIADCQCRLDENDWLHWCQRLKAVLLDTKDSQFLKDFASLDTGMDPLAILREPSFRPVFAESNETEAGYIYEAMLDSVAAAWGPDKFNAALTI